MREKPRCRCGVYEWAHQEGRGCGDYRKASALRLWFADHNIWWHIQGWAWLRLRNDRSRIAAADRYYAKHPELCWCDMVTAALLDDKRSDFPDLCDVPLLRETLPPRPGWCYCPNSEVRDA